MLVAVSSCLLGNPVRYDGRTKKNDYILNRLADYCEFKPICPEHEAFGTPRETIRIEFNPQESQKPLKVVQNFQKNDVTAQLQAVIRKHVASLKESGVCGVILKSKSPSCGVGSTPRFANGFEYDTGDGLFADAIIRELPHLPIIEETGLSNNWKRDQFLLHLFSYANIQNLSREELTHQTLREFHEAQRLLLSMKNQSILVALDELLSAAKFTHINEVFSEYKILFKQAIATGTTARQCADTLNYLARSVTTSPIPESLLAVIEQFQHGEVSLSTVVTSLNEFFEETDVDDYSSQSLLTAYPAALAIRTQ